VSRQTDAEGGSTSDRTIGIPKPVSNGAASDVSLIGSGEKPQQLRNQRGLAILVMAELTSTQRRKKEKRLKHLIVQITASVTLVSAAMLGATHASAQPGESADELVRNANNTLQLIDEAHFDIVWDGAAPFVKAKIEKGRFVTDTQRARQLLGTVTKRGWTSVTRVQYTGDQNIPNGMYANVDFFTTLASGSTVFERLSFRLETDGHWHLTGYVPRQSQDVVTPPPPEVAKQ